jgi:hypothetical protein
VQSKYNFNTDLRFTKEQQGRRNDLMSRCYFLFALVKNFNSCEVGPCQHGMARPRVVGGEEALHVWRVTANILTKHSGRPKGGDPPSSGLGGG